MGRTVLTLVGLTAIAGATLGHWPLERGDTSVAPLASTHDVLPEDVRPVLEGRGDVPPPSSPTMYWSNTQPASAQEETTTDEVWERVKEPPPDPVEAGNSSLVVAVTEEETTQPLSVTLQLWRIRAPGNADWMPGDQLQAKGKSLNGEATFEGLPEGMYRVSSEDQRKDSDDPAAFEVRGNRTAVEVRSPVRRKFDVYLRLLDVDGEPVKHAERRDGGTGWSSRGPHVPDWVEARAPRGSSPEWPLVCGGGGGRSHSHSWFRPVQADERGFFVCNSLESSRTRSPTSSHTFRVAGANDTWAYVRGDPARDRTLLAVALPLDTLIAGVRTSDGRSFPRADAKVEATCKAVLLEAGTAEDVWRTLPIEVEVTVPDHAPLKFTASPADPSPRHTLLPLEDPSPR